MSHLKNSFTKSLQRILRIVVTAALAALVLGAIGVAETASADT